MNDGLKIWIDDKREKPGEEWVRVTNADTVIELYEHNEIEVLSIDHDLVRARNGYDVLEIIEKLVLIDGYDPPGEIRGHAASGGVHQEMNQSIQSIYWSGS